MKNTVTTARVLAEIPSQSNPTKMYEIRLGADGVVYCTCRGWVTKKYCKHLEKYHAACITATTVPGSKTTAELLTKMFQESFNKVMDINTAIEEIKFEKKVENFIKQGIIGGKWDGI